MKDNPVVQGLETILIYDKLSTTAIAARNFHIALETGHGNILTMCATCYAILKKSAKLLNHNKKTRNKVNNILNRSDLEKMEYKIGDMDPSKNIFHVAEIFFNKKENISKLVQSL